MTLLGDAAHPVLPHAGQGAAQALEDAVGTGPGADAGCGRSSQRFAGIERVARTIVHERFIALGPRIRAVTTTRNRVVQDGARYPSAAIDSAGAPRREQVAGKDPFESVAMTDGQMRPGKSAPSKSLNASEALSPSARSLICSPARN